MKYINIKSDKFSTILKKLKLLKLDLIKIFKFKYIKRYHFEKILKYLHIRRFSFEKIIQYFKIINNNILYIKKIKFKSYKVLLIHLPISIIFFTFLYLAIPTFYNYDKSNITNIACKNKNIKCLIEGEISYRFYPSPRLKIKGLKVNSLLNKKNLITAEDVTIKLFTKNLLAKEKHKFKKIDLRNFKINLDLSNLDIYKKSFKINNNLIPIEITKGQIILFDGESYISLIDKANLNIKIMQDSVEANLKGKIFNKGINVNFLNDSINEKDQTEITLKMPGVNLFTKVSFLDFKKNKNVNNGNFTIRKDKNRIAGIFNYKANKFTIKKANIRNTFIDGKIDGKITLLPYFNFDLDLILNSINFTKLYNYFLTLDKQEKNNLFQINNKINGKLNFSANKIYSKHNLAKSFESRLKFNNGNIKIEQFLISLGKLGAADLLGGINNNKKNSAFKFESNVFVDNQKRFLSKFGIYNRKSLPSNLFISGNFDLENIKATFYEISNNKKLNAEDTNFIESEFNDLMLEDGFTNLFNFSKLKVLLKSITDENN